MTHRTIHTDRGCKYVIEEKEVASKGIDILHKDGSQLSSHSVRMLKIIGRDNCPVCTITECC